MGDTFLRVLTSVVSGERQLEEFAIAMVGAAVEDALLCVSRDYGHDYTAMVARYKDVMVDRHATVGVGNSTCRARKPTGARCDKRALCRGYCRTHQDARENEESRRKVIRVHKTAHVAPKDTVESALRSMGVHVQPASAWLIPRTDTTDLLAADVLAADVLAADVLAADVLAASPFTKSDSESA